MYRSANVSSLGGQQHTAERPSRLYHRRSERIPVRPRHQPVDDPVEPIYRTWSFSSSQTNKYASHNFYFVLRGFYKLDSLISAKSGQPINCCTGKYYGGTPIKPPPSPECAPIIIPSNDPIYNPNGTPINTCMNYVRTQYQFQYLEGLNATSRQQVIPNIFL